MAKTNTTRYDVTEQFRIPEEMAAYLEAYPKETNGDAFFIAGAPGDIARAKGMSQVARDAACQAKAFSRPFPESEFSCGAPIIDSSRALNEKLVPNLHQTP